MTGIDRPGEEQEDVDSKAGRFSSWGHATSGKIPTVLGECREISKVTSPDFGKMVSQRLKVSPGIS